MRRNPGVRAWTAGLAAAGLLAFAGCGGDDPKTVTVAQTGGTPSERPDGAADGGGATTTPVDTSDALAARTVRAVDSKDGTVDMAIVSMKVQGELMRLTVAFKPTFPSASPDEDISLYDMNGNSPLYVTLVDPVNLKRYLVVKDSAGSSLGTDEVSAGTPSGWTVTGTWTFAAPPADVTKVDVQVGDWEPMNDVPVQR